MSSDEKEKMKKRYKVEKPSNKDKGKKSKNGTVGDDVLDKYADDDEDFYMLKVNKKNKKKDNEDEQ